MTFNLDLFRVSVKLYITNHCTITHNLNETVAMRNIYEDFLHWARTRGIHMSIEGSTIQQFGRVLRMIEHEENVQLVRGRSGKSRRWVETYIKSYTSKIGGV